MSDPKQIVITMEVDRLHLNEKNVEQKVRFSDDHGGRQNGSPKEFVSKVRKNQKIIWRGVTATSNGSDDHVEILEVTRKKSNGGERLLDHTKPGKDGTVEGKIKDEDMKGTESYDLQFKLNDTVYVVDPKLQMMSIDELQEQ